jgi:hypothetical protein
MLHRVAAKRETGDGDGGFDAMLFVKEGPLAAGAQHPLFGGSLKYSFTCSVAGDPWLGMSLSESLGQISTQYPQLMHRRRSRVNVLFGRSTTIAPAGHFFWHAVQ